MFKSSHLVVFVLLSAALALTACGGAVAPQANAPASSGQAATPKAGAAAPGQATAPKASGPASDQPATPPTANSPTVAPITLPTSEATNNNSETGGENGTEAALVTYADAAQGFAIGYPGPWTQDKSVTKGVRFVGGDDSLTLEFVTPAKGMDAMTYAQNDVAAVSAAFPGFKQLNLNASTEVKNAIVLGFEANGTSTVTGKAFTAHDERYYMPLADGRIAILTVTGPANHYDREGVRDIALTFKVMK